MIPYLARLALLGAIVVLVGTVAFRLVVLRRATISDSVVALCTRVAGFIGMLTAAALVLLVPARLDFQVRSLLMPGESWGAMAKVLLNSTRWGAVWYLQFALSLIALAAFVACVRGSRRAWTIAALAVAALAITPALSGHAMSSEGMRALLVPTDVLHVLGAGTWVGTLALLLVAGVFPLRRTQSPDANEAIAALVVSFSPLAQLSAGLVVVSGVVASWKHLQTVSALFLTTYGRVLLGKIALVGIVAAVGFHNWKRVTPTIATDGSERLIKSASRELFVAIAVLIMTAILIATPQPRMIQ